MVNAIKMSAVKLVIFDLDETLWRVDNGYCSILRPPFQEITPDTLIDSIGRTITLQKGAREILKSLADAGVILSVASMNDPQPATEVMQRFGIYGYFKHPQLEWNSKMRLVKRLLALLETEDGISISPDEALMVDDWESNLDEVHKLGLRTLHFGTDITQLDEVRNLVLEDDL